MKALGPAPDHRDVGGGEPERRGPPRKSAARHGRSDRRARCWTAGSCSSRSTASPAWRSSPSRTWPCTRGPSTATRRWTSSRATWSRHPGRHRRDVQALRPGRIDVREVPRGILPDGPPSGVRCAPMSERVGDVLRGADRAGRQLHERLRGRGAVLRAVGVPEDRRLRACALRARPDARRPRPDDRAGRVLLPRDARPSRPSRRSSGSSAC